MTFKEQLSLYIQTVFDNEEAFIKRFLDCDALEVIECYMADHSTRIATLSDTKYAYGIVTYTIDTPEFIAWCEEQE